ncbi:DDRGK1 [Lepeophtheirus salmonis]|uniref:DDRGK domain-containing protein 1 n=1 Tax=Lepeophtheirus salmonis TaxID=72036 RepID=A0A7R8D6F2_LEPSM|nr:DDRGK1 [Lepeophtheirus salmonis]CAF3044270.1 DDRGK1 [Lepeophtheirus salmonis]
MLEVIIGVLIVLLSIAIYIKSKRKENNEVNEGGARRTGGGRGGRGLARMRRGVTSNTLEEDEEEANEEESLLEEAGMKLPDGKNWKKKDGKASNEGGEETGSRELERQKEQQLEKEDEERKEAIRQKEHEEYLKLKEAFVVDQEEDLASHFKMKAHDTIDRVQKLQEDGTLTGVIDDRGKFIYVSPDELEGIAKFIRQRGRVSITDIAENSHKLIKMNPVVTTS